MGAGDGNQAVVIENILDQHDDDLETYLLLMSVALINGRLSDSALPTGGFVASSGLESFVQHGFIASSQDGGFTLPDFLLHSLTSYAVLNLPFFQQAHHAASLLRTTEVSAHGSLMYAETLQKVLAVDADLESMMLNHVTRRASKAQGVALLTLYSRAFASIPSPNPETPVMDTLFEDLKAASRRPVRMQGHLPVCFAVLTAALGLSLDRSLHLHLFLQARAILSSAVRLNLIGPYAAQRLLLKQIKDIVDRALQEWRARKPACADGASKGSTAVNGSKNREYQDEEDGPATTWPLGEILGARHDQLHSRIFNS